MIQDRASLWASSLHLEMQIPALGRDSGYPRPPASEIQRELQARRKSKLPRVTYELRSEA